MKTYLAKAAHKSGTWAMFIGRWQPWHDGHRWLIDQALEEGKKVNIIIRLGKGSDKPLDPGHQHKGNYIEEFKSLCKNIEFHNLKNWQDIEERYHNTAVSLWIFANSLWMIGEFFHLDEHPPYLRKWCLLPFGLGISIILYYYLFIFKKTNNFLIIYHCFFLLL